jgi:hypothetical protein
MPAPTWLLGYCNAGYAVTTSAPLRGLPHDRQPIASPSPAHRQPIADRAGRMKIPRHGAARVASVGAAARIYGTILFFRDFTFPA